MRHQMDSGIRTSWKNKIFLKLDLSKSFLFATELRATPPAMHMFFEFVSL